MTAQHFSKSRPPLSPPLAGIRVVDFSTLLPGPLCSLLLAQAGADVIKVERPGCGDEMRTYPPYFDGGSINFALLNQGKKSVVLDLKNPDAVQEAIALVRSADVLVEQFRPGVMKRLGLGYEAMRAANPGLVYCAITGWGQDGPLASIAGHDLNYQAESGLLSLTAGADGAPVLPNLLAADIAGGAYPAMINILLALRTRDCSGEGAFIDIAMADNLHTFNYSALGSGFAEGVWPTAGSGVVNGGTPRYQIYRTRDDRFLAVASLEQKFWGNFLGVIGAPQLLDSNADPVGVRMAVAEIIGSRTAAEWMERFQGVDACVSVVNSLQEASESPHFHQRGVFDRRIADAQGREIPAIHLPIAPQFRRSDAGTAPRLGASRTSDFVLSDQLTASLAARSQM